MTTTSLSRDITFSQWLSLGILVSVILHLLLFYLAQAKWTTTFPPASPSVIEVSLAPTSSPRIISEPQSEVSEAVPKTARFRAEQNRSTEREQIRRGDGRDAGPVVGANKAPRQPSPEDNSRSPAPSSSSPPPAAPQAARPPAPPPRTSGGAKPLKTLRLSDDALVGEFGAQRETEKSQGPPAREFLKSPLAQSGHYRPFSRPIGSGARFLGNAGNSDYLPQLPDGDITLLNAKASRYAVFVRRVATQVFSNLRASGWESLSSADIRRMKDFSTVHVVLSPAGELLSISQEGESGSRSFDDVLREAVRAGASDPNPPPGALAADGKIHFIFKAKSWSQVGPSRGGRGIAEHRWLLLSTGLG
ncbi:TonB C-terminal domain-containing protein [bacterium]|nr:TonB C-terminal domain-containing protein [bacterium]